MVECLLAYLHRCPRPSTLVPVCQCTGGRRRRHAVCQRLVALRLHRRPHSVLLNVAERACVFFSLSPRQQWLECCDETKMRRSLAASQCSAESRPKEVQHKSVQQRWLRRKSQLVIRTCPNKKKDTEPLAIKKKCAEELVCQDQLSATPSDHSHQA